MPVNLSDTAILLFSRSAAAESLEKPLTRFKSGGKTGLAAQLIRHTRKIADQSGLPVFFVSENLQQGLSFGERFAGAFELLFSRGFEQVISIGNDCPSLNAGDIRLAAQYLKTKGAVFGPATDGGAYLIGLNRAVFNPLAFAALDWQTDHTLEDLKVYAAADYYTLSEKADLDSPAELQKQLQQGNFPRLLKARLLAFMKPACAIRVTSIRSIPFAARIPALVLRGPPAC